MLNAALRYEVVRTWPYVTQRHMYHRCYRPTCLSLMAVTGSQIRSTGRNGGREGGEIPQNNISNGGVTIIESIAITYFCAINCCGWSIEENGRTDSTGGNHPISPWLD